jgi:hypothetical protein
MFNCIETCRSENASLWSDAYWEGGQVRSDPKTPEGLLACLHEWLDTVEAHPVSYTVSLAPYIIARGPQPPNEEDLEHQRDVLKICARMRSQAIDRLNLIEYMMDPLHASEFNFEPGGPDLAKLHAAISTDLDIIAAAASWAVDHPKEALEPEAFARDPAHKGLAGYEFTLLPPNMPKHDGAIVTVPDFSDASTEDLVKQLAGTKQLKYLLTYDNHLGGINDQFAANFKIVDQNPGRGLPVTAGTTVKLTAHKLSVIDPRPVDHDGTRHQFPPPG